VGDDQHLQRVVVHDYFNVPYRHEEFRFMGQVHGLIKERNALGVSGGEALIHPVHVGRKHGNNDEQNHPRKYK
jgi:hypothetical protein